MRARRRTTLLRTAKPCGPGIRCWCQVDGDVFGPTGRDHVNDSSTTVTRRIRRRGERDISRKAIAQGMSDCLRCPVCSCAHFLVHIAHETAGAARIRHSLRPLIPEGGDYLQTSGASRRGIERLCLDGPSALREALATKQSILTLPHDGLLRFARNDG